MIEEIAQILCELISNESISANSNLDIIDYIERLLAHRASPPGVGQAGTLVRIGVISDTHGLLSPEAEQRLAGVAHIVHAGDIGRPDIIVGLRRIAPVIAIRGNVDTDHWAERYPDTKMVRVGGRSIYVLHDIHELQLDPASCGVDMVMLEGNLSYSGPISGARNNATARSSRKKNRTIMQQPSA